MNAEETSADGRRFEILKEAGAPEVFDQLDHTASGYRAGTPDQFYWKIVRHVGEPPRDWWEDIQQSGFFGTPDDVEADIRRVKADDPSLSDLPVVRQF